MKRKPYNNATVTTAHSIRTLRVCDECGGLGNVDSMLRIYRTFRGSRAQDAVHVHGRCFIKLFGIRSLLARPQGDTDRLTLGDIGVHAAKALLRQRERNS
jgi:hypothetical protein